MALNWQTVQVCVDFPHLSSPFAAAWFFQFHRTEFLIHFSRRIMSKLRAEAPVWQMPSMPMPMPRQPGYYMCIFVPATHPAPQWPEGPVATHPALEWAQSSPASVSEGSVHLEAGAAHVIHMYSNYSTPSKKVQVIGDQGARALNDMRHAVFVTCYLFLIMCLLHPLLHCQDIT